MTEAIDRNECWSPRSPLTGPQQQQQQEEQCNVCGLHLTTDRGLYMAGNIWTADCHYIKQLKEPRQFQARMEALAQDALMKQSTGDFIMTQYPSSNEAMFFGVGRYAAEWWIGSHPSFRACDFSRSINPNPIESGGSGAGYDRTKEFFNYVMHEAAARQQQQNLRHYTSSLEFTPHAPYHSYKLPKPKALKSRLKQDPQAFKHEFFLLPGLLFRWIVLYDSVPSQYSWVWQHYPEGEWWKEIVRQHGTNVLNVVWGKRVSLG